MGDSQPDRTTIVAWLLSIVVGGGNAVGVRLTVFELVDPFWGAAIRFAIAGLIFAAFMLVLRTSVGSRASVVGTLLYGLVGFAASYASCIGASRRRRPHLGNHVRRHYLRACPAWELGTLSTPVAIRVQAGFAD